ncbi:hypothetical protein Bbelb_114220 [Branchiostoma belcheri]|nr:hypothetical protein Bbelb_114220 [Branchiostoma belcheri]
MSGPPALLERKVPGSGCARCCDLSSEAAKLGTMSSERWYDSCCDIEPQGKSAWPSGKNIAQTSLHQTEKETRVRGVNTLIENVGVGGIVHVWEEYALIDSRTLRAKASPGPSHDMSTRERKSQVHSSQAFERHVYSKVAMDTGSHSTHSTSFVLTNQVFCMRASVLRLTEENSYDTMSLSTLRKMTTVNDLSQVETQKLQDGDLRTLRKLTHESGEGKMKPEQEGDAASSFSESANVSKLVRGYEAWLSSQSHGVSSGIPTHALPDTDRALFSLRPSVQRIKAGLEQRTEQPASTPSDAGVVTGTPPPKPPRLHHGDGVVTGTPPPNPPRLHHGDSVVTGTPPPKPPRLHHGDGVVTGTPPPKPPRLHHGDGVVTGTPPPKPPRLHHGDGVVTGTPPPKPPRLHHGDDTGETTDNPPVPPPQPARREQDFVIYRDHDGEWYRFLASDDDLLEVLFGAGDWELHRLYFHCKEAEREATLEVGRLDAIDDLPVRGLTSDDLFDVLTTSVNPVFNVRPLRFTLVTPEDQASEQEFPSEEETEENGDTQQQVRPVRKRGRLAAFFSRCRRAFTSCWRR